MNALVDTSVWSLALRRRARDLSAAERPLVVELAELVNEGRARIVGLVRQELLSGIKSPAQYEELRLALLVPLKAVRMADEAAQGLEGAVDVDPQAAHGAGRGRGRDLPRVHAGAPGYGPAS